NERQEFLTRFRREADVIAQLDHVNILPIYEYGEQDGLAYLVMPYLTGGSLRDLLARQGPLSLTVALSYIEQDAAALQYAHEHRIVHRDIKPANILFHSDGRLVLADFGIARIIRDPNEPIEATLTGPSHFIGSVDYMSPEMVNGTPVDHRTDIYELGIVLFQMLAGRVPFQGTTPFIIAAQHLREQPPSLSLLKPGIPPAVDAVVHKALAKEPDARYDSAQEMAQALRAAITPSGYGVARENTYTTQPMPPSHTTYTAPQRSYDSAYETLPAGYSEVRVPHARTAGSTPQAYQHTASYGWSVDEQQQVAQPAASSPSDTGNPRWPIWIITLCLVVFIGGGLLLALPTLKGLLGISGHPL
ncbi:MAG TPA: protein kinase, partial [Ktedonobacteraceae bacterium]|nr:protein kinase [Ktedonobacteraceae bacterium]